MMNAGTKIEPDESIRILIPLHPYTKKNSQEIYFRTKTDEGNTAQKVPFIFPSKQYKRYEQDCRIFMRSLGIDYPVNVQAHYYMNSLRAVDLTNLHQALHDAMVNNGLISDDNCRLIVSTDGSRVFYDKNNPRTEVLITRTELTFPKCEAKRKRKENEYG